jgi:hypothetical protein
MRVLEAILDDDPDTIRVVDPDYHSCLGQVTWRMPFLLRSHPQLISIACALGAELCVDHLIDVGADMGPCTQGFYPWHYAAASGSVSILIKLEAFGAPILQRTGAYGIQEIAILWRRRDVLLHADIKEGLHPGSPKGDICRFGGGHEVFTYVPPLLVSAVESGSTENVAYLALHSGFRGRLLSIGGCPGLVHFICAAGGDELVSWYSSTFSHLHFRQTASFPFLRGGRSTLMDCLEVAAFMGNHSALRGLLRIRYGTDWPTRSVRRAFYFAVSRGDSASLGELSDVLAWSLGDRATRIGEAKVRAELLGERGMAGQLASVCRCRPVWTRAQVLRLAVRGADMLAQNLIRAPPPARLFRELPRHVHPLLRPYARLLLSTFLEGAPADPDLLASYMEATGDCLDAAGWPPETHNLFAARRFLASNLRCDVPRAEWGDFLALVTPPERYLLLRSSPVSLWMDAAAMIGFPSEISRAADWPLLCGCAFDRADAHLDSPRALAGAMASLLPWLDRIPEVYCPVGGGCPCSSPVWLWAHDEMLDYGFCFDREVGLHGPLRRLAARADRRREERESQAFIRGESAGRRWALACRPIAPNAPLPP